MIMLFKIVDAFAERLFGGNAAGVVIIREGGSFPTNDIMLKVAAELRYSETAFVKLLGDNRFKIRFFTPVAEVELCGHATIGAFHALLEEGMVERDSVYEVETLQGVLGVEVKENGSILMDMAKPQLYEYIKDKDAVDELYSIMGLQRADGHGVCNVNPQLYLHPRIVSTGLRDIMLPVANEEELYKVAPDFAALAELSKRYNVVGVHAFTCNSKDGRVHARNFAPLYGIDEEAATGTSNGALACYLFDYGIVAGDQTVNVIQGEKMGRPSLISAQILLRGGELSVKVGGRAVTLAGGNINL